MEKYHLEKVGSLFLTKAAIKGREGTKVMRLLVDTGSTYTVLPVEVLESVGCSPAESRELVKIITGSGTIIAPKVEVIWFQSLGQKADRFKAVAHTLPFSGPIDGLLGMDFLLAVKAYINLGSGIIRVLGWPH